jgi:hypothetical protein
MLALDLRDDHIHFGQCQRGDEMNPSASRPCLGPMAVRIPKQSGNDCRSIPVDSDFPLGTHRPRSSCSHLWARPSFRESGIGSDTRVCRLAGSINPDSSSRRMRSGKARLLPRTSTSLATGLPRAVINSFLPTLGVAQKSPEMRFCLSHACCADSHAYPHLSYVTSRLQT